MSGVPVGFTLPPAQDDLGLLRELLLELPDYYEVAPETLWREGEAGELVPNDYHALFLDLRARTERPFVAHGVGWSPGTVARGDEERRARWKRAIARSHAAFDFQWYSDHLGASSLAGEVCLLPLPLPMTASMAAHLRARMAELQELVPTVGLENSVFYHHFGQVLEEPAFLADALDAAGMHLVLDLHNVHTTCLNAGVEPGDWLERAPLERVIELHLSGGSDSEPAWLASGGVRRLDSHDDAIPEAVWELYEAWAPRCSALRGITIERMEGTLSAAAVPVAVAAGLIGGQ